VREASAELAMGEALQGLARQRLEGLARSELSWLRQKENSQEIHSFYIGVKQPLVGLWANTSARTSRFFRFILRITHMQQPSSRVIPGACIRERSITSQDSLATNRTLQALHYMDIYRKFRRQQNQTLRQQSPECASFLCARADF
jgi:hypothetical protein